MLTYVAAQVWDLETRCCIQTIVGHRCEIWSLAVLVSAKKGSDETSAEQLEDNVSIVTGSSDEFIRGYRLKAQSSDAVTGADLGEEQDVLEYYGCAVRGCPTDKCTGLFFNSTGALLAAQSSGKTIEVLFVSKRS